MRRLFHEMTFEASPAKGPEKEICVRKPTCTCKTKPKFSMTRNGVRRQNGRPWAFHTNPSCPYKLRQTR